MYWFYTLVIVNITSPLPTITTKPWSSVKITTEYLIKNTTGKDTKHRQLKSLKSPAVKIRIIMP